MILRQAARAAMLRRDAYLRAVLSSHGVADAVVIVAVVYTALALTIGHRAVVEVVGHARFLLDGAIAWLVLTGAIYLAARHLLRGEGSYQGTLAATGLAHPVLLVLILARLGAPWPLTVLGRHPTLLGFERVWLLDLLPMLALLAALAWFAAILVAATRVAMSLPLDRAALAVGVGYAAWWVVGTLLF